MIAKWLEQAKRGQTVWLPDVREGCARMEDAVPVTMQLTLCDGSKRDFSLPLPRWQNEQEQQFVKQYVTACVYNTLSACSGREMAFYLDARKSEAAALLGQLDEVFQVRRTARSGYGKVINIADRLCRAFGGGRFAFAVRPQEDYSPAPDAAPVQGQLTERLRQAAARCGSGVCCGIDIGGTDIKAAVAADGRLVCVKEYDWNPAASPTAEGIIAPIELLVRLMACCAAGLTPALERALDKNAGDAVMAQAVAESLSVPLDVLGVSFPDVVIRNRIVGGETYKTRGMRENTALDYEAQFARITDLCTLLRAYVVPGGAVMNTNDGPMAAFTAAVEQAAAGADVSRGFFAHTLGTELGTGWVRPDGSIPEIPLEVYNFIIDLGSFPQKQYDANDVRSINNFNTLLPGTLQKYTCQSGVFRHAARDLPEQDAAVYAEALEKGLLLPQGSRLIVPTEPKDMRKPCLEYFMAMAADPAHPACAEIFRRIGEYLAVTWSETQYILLPETPDRTLFGRLVKNPVCLDLMCQGAARREPELHQYAADGSLANTALMRQLDRHPDYTVAQFAQAVGAIFYGCMGLL